MLSDLASTPVERLARARRDVASSSILPIDPPASERVQASFERDGFLGPVQLFTPRECRALLTYLDDHRRPAPADWQKGGAVTDWLLYRLAADPRLIDVLRPILGEDFILWGCSAVRRHPGEIHPWHVDVETSAPDGSFVSVWIGLENTRSKPGLQLVAGSHVAGATVQQVQAQHGFGRGKASTETVLAWARERNTAAALVCPELDDGDAILFDGRLWHGSRNERRSGTRSALLLQFASVDTPVRMHNEAKLEWPFEFAKIPKPPTILVHGSDEAEINRVVPPPMPAPGKAIPMLSTCVRSIGLPLQQGESGWQPYDFFRGSTPVIDDMECHASVLSAGHCPHPPHSHAEEELLIILDGEAELLIADKPSFEGARVEKAGQGAFAYYPAFQHHTIRNSGTEPVSYLMFKWHVDGATAAANPLRTAVFRFEDAKVHGTHGFAVERLFEQPTGWLGKLHCHTTRLAPGGGYAAHVDAYDVAILMLSGRVETLGQEVGPYSVIYYSAGQKHGMRNIGDEPAHYLVFEFHPASLNLGQRLRWRTKPFAKRVAKRTARVFGVDLHRLRSRFGASA